MNTAERLRNRSTHCFAWLLACLIDCLVACLLFWFTDSLVLGSNGVMFFVRSLIDWLVDWLIDWLIDWSTPLSLCPLVSCYFSCQDQCMFSWRTYWQQPPTKLNVMSNGTNAKHSTGGLFTKSTVSPLLRCSLSQQFPFNQLRHCTALPSIKLHPISSCGRTNAQSRWWYDVRCNNVMFVVSALQTTRQNGPWHLDDGFFPLPHPASHSWTDWWEEYLPMH